MICYAVFHANRQLRVFPAVIGAALAFEKAREFALNSHSAGYPCSVEEFSFSAYIGKLVFDTLKEGK